MKTILKRSQTTLMASTLSLLQAQSSLFFVCNRPATGLFFVCKRLATGSIEPVIGLQPACFRLQSACNRLDRACNRPVASRLQTKTSRLQAQSSLLQADYRLNQAGCKPITGSIEPVASRLQTKTSRLQACCNIYFSPLSNCSRFKSAKKGSENEKCLKIPSFLLQTRSNVIFQTPNFKKKNFQSCF